MRRKKENNFLKDMDIYVDPEKKNKALTAVSRAVSEKVIHYNPGPFKILWIQLHYISPSGWIAQSFSLLVFSLLFYRLGAGNAVIQDYILWFSIGSALLGLSGISELGSHFSCHMAELEQSCYLNLRQLWGIKMILFGGADILMLSLVTGGIAWKTRWGFSSVGIYLLVPFLLSSLCYLLTLSALRGGTGRYVRLGLAAVLGLAAAAPSMYPPAYKAQFLWVWTFTLMVAIVLLAFEIRAIMGKMTKGEALCWN